MEFTKFRWFNVTFHYTHNKYNNTLLEFSSPFASWSHWPWTCWWSVNTLRPRQDGLYFVDDVLKCIFLNENMWISLKSPLKFIPRGPFNNIPALVQIMACRRPGNKPLSESMLVFVPTHICVTRPQWVKMYLYRYIWNRLLVILYFSNWINMDSN